jgi:hypothetical protein
LERRWSVLGSTGLWPTRTRCAQLGMLCCWPGSTNRSMWFAMARWPAKSCAHTEMLHLRNLTDLLRADEDAIRGAHEKKGRFRPLTISPLIMRPKAATARNICPLLRLETECYLHRAVVDGQVARRSPIVLRFAHLPRRERPARQNTGHLPQPAARPETSPSTVATPSICSPGTQERASIQTNRRPSCFS